MVKFSLIQIQKAKTKTKMRIHVNDLIFLLFKYRKQNKEQIHGYTSMISLFSRIGGKRAKMAYRHEIILYLTEASLPLDILFARIQLYTFFLCLSK